MWALQAHQSGSLTDAGIKPQNGFDDTLTGSLDDSGRLALGVNLEVMGPHALHACGQVVGKGFSPAGGGEGPRQRNDLAPMRVLVKQLQPWLNRMLLTGFVESLKPSLNHVLDVKIDNRMFQVRPIVKCSMQRRCKSKRLAHPKPF